MNCAHCKCISILEDNHKYCKSGYLRVGEIYTSYAVSLNRRIYMYDIPYPVP